MDRSVTLVVLPGLDGTEVFLRPFLALLPATISPVLVTYPATGGNSYDDLLTLVRQAVATIPEFYVFASSFSGPLAVMLAAAEPHKTRGLILSATFLRSPQDDFRRFRFAAVTPIIWFLRAARRVPIWTLRRKDDAMRQAKAETWRRVSARSLAARTRAILGVDAREALRAVRQPVLCISHAEDRAVPRTNSEEILRCCPTAELVTLPGQHLAIFTDPSPSAEAVIRFIEEQESASRDG